MQGHTVTVVNAAAYHYYSGMGPGLLSGLYRPENVRFDVKTLVEESGGTFVQDNVTRIDPDNRRVYTQSGQEISYDVMSCNIGSQVKPLQEMTPGDAVFAVKPIENLLKARKKILKILHQQGHVTVTVVGGGAAGVEMAANVRALVDAESGEATVYLIAGTALLGRFAKGVRKHALASLKKSGVLVKEGLPVQSFTQGHVELPDGFSCHSDVLLLTTGTRPPSLFADSGLPVSEDGGLLVNEHLQSIRYPEIFGGGDCISFEPRPLDRVGVYAVRENPLLLHNVLAALNGDSYETFSPQKSYMLILNMGNGIGIMFRNSLVLKGKSVFWLKNYLDTAFMRKFQVSGEREEKEE
jgi:NADH dehydrogenase FAD-containing subunit